MKDSATLPILGTACLMFVAACAGETAPAPGSIVRLRWRCWRDDCPVGACHACSKDFLFVVGRRELAGDEHGTRLAFVDFRHVTFAEQLEDCTFEASRGGSSASSVKAAVGNQL